MLRDVANVAVGRPDGAVVAARDAQVDEVAAVLAEVPAGRADGAPVVALVRVRFARRVVQVDGVRVLEAVGAVLPRRAGIGVIVGADGQRWRASGHGRQQGGIVTVVAVVKEGNARGANFESIL